MVGQHAEGREFGSCIFGGSDIGMLVHKMKVVIDAKVRSARTANSLLLRDGSRATRQLSAFGARSQFQSCRQPVRNRRVGILFPTCSSFCSSRNVDLFPRLLYANI